MNDVKKMFITADEMQWSLIRKSLDAMGGFFLLLLRADSKHQTMVVVVNRSSETNDETEETLKRWRARAKQHHDKRQLNLKRQQHCT